MYIIYFKELLFGMKTIISALNGNDSMTREVYERVYDRTSAKRTSDNLLQFGRVEDVDLKPVLTAQSLRGLPQLELELRYAPTYYVAGLDIDNQSEIFDDAEAQPYAISSATVQTSEDVKLPEELLSFRYSLSKDEVADSIQSGLYDDLDTFKSRLKNHFIGTYLRRPVPAVVETTAVDEDTTLTLITDIDTVAHANRYTALTNVSDLWNTALEGVASEYQDDIEKAAIEARQKARALELEQQKQTDRSKVFDELKLDEDDHSDGAFDRRQELILQNAEGEVRDLLSNMSVDDVSTIDQAIEKQSDSPLSVDVDDDDLMSALMAEEPIDSEASFSERQVAELMSSDSESGSKTSHKAKKLDDELEL